MHKANVTTQHQSAADRTAAKLPGILALIFGVFMVFGTGFAQPSAMHNAAHDVRHAFTFPCH